jgi:hypothetical protein
MIASLEIFRGQCCRDGRISLHRQQCTLRASANERIGRRNQGENHGDHAISATRIETVRYRNRPSAISPTARSGIFSLSVTGADLRVTSL